MPQTKSRKGNIGKSFSEVSVISEVSEFSTWPTITVHVPVRKIFLYTPFKSAFTSSSVSKTFISNRNETFSLALKGKIWHFGKLFAFMIILVASATVQRALQAHSSTGVSAVPFQQSLIILEFKDSV